MFCKLRVRVVLVVLVSRSAAISTVDLFSRSERVTRRLMRQREEPFNSGSRGLSHYHVLSLSISTSKVHSFNNYYNYNYNMLT